MNDLSYYVRKLIEKLDQRVPSTNSTDSYLWPVGIWCVHQSERDELNKILTQLRKLSDAPIEEKHWKGQMANYD
jgi:hypothetical protein